MVVLQRQQGFLVIIVSLCLISKIVSSSSLRSNTATENNHNNNGTTSNYLRDDEDKGGIRSSSRRNLVVDPKTVELKTHNHHKHNPRRKFVSYTSSEWESTWLLNVNRWASAGKICDVLLHYQSAYVHDFFNATCTARYPPPNDHWCIIDDTYRPLYYNSAERHHFEYQWRAPFPETIVLPESQPVQPTSEMEHILSKFVFLDETTGEEYVEYIEPLVSHLRFSLAGCNTGTIHENEEFHEYSFRGWVLPPPPLRTRTRTRTHGSGGKQAYFDAGASDWSSGQGGPSLSYFHTMWGRHSIVFDQIYAYEMRTTVDDFYQTVPEQYQNLVKFQQCAVSSQESDHDDDTHPFIPKVIQQKYGTPEDYVLFKLDIDSPNVENGNIDFILQDETTTIDELVYEHHIGGNYIMARFWGHNDDITLRESYDLFLKLRLKGIRAHSWV